MRAQVAARAVGVLLGLQGSINPLSRTPSYQAVADLPLAEQARVLSRIDCRESLIAELRENDLRFPLERVYVLGDPPQYEPPPEASVAARAGRSGVDAYELYVDLLLEDDGRALLYLPYLNYFDGNFDAAAEMIAHPRAVPGLSDGGAHVGTICDASFPTSLLTHWGRDRTRGATFDIGFLVQRQSRATAEAVGLLDRGLLAPGYKADLNVIDFDKLRVEAPVMKWDLPAGGKRLLQKARGYRATVVSGAVTYRDGEATGALPGRLVRGARVL
jgi:N-acyl-D-aspartate/D-glutamate deacylase